MRRILSLRCITTYTWLCVAYACGNLVIVWELLYDPRLLSTMHPRLQKAVGVASDTADIIMLLLAAWGIALLIYRPWRHESLTQRRTSFYRRSVGLGLSLVLLAFFGLFWLWPTMEIIPPPTLDQVVRFWVLAGINLIVVSLLVLLQRVRNA